MSSRKCLRSVLTGILLATVLGSFVPGAQAAVYSTRPDYNRLYDKPPVDVKNRWQVRKGLGTATTDLQTILSLQNGGAETEEEVWRFLFESDAYVIGPRSNRVRANDRVEDWDLNFVSPKHPNITLYSVLETAGSNGNFIMRSDAPLSIANNTFEGRSLMAPNDEFIAMSDDDTLWVTPEGALQAYHFASGSPRGGRAYQADWIAFKDGPYAGKSWNEVLPYFIGAEEEQLIFLEGEKRLIVYRYLTAGGKNDGTHVVTVDDFTLANGLEGIMPGDLIDGMLPGYTYIGWDAFGPNILNITARQKYGTEK